ncbi:hypothetical protein AMTRI_Chr08g204350 [Amborella trichopoda]|uniref:CRAL-TRIO domain-containing protein n=1 Tax=Amborella trichopoda TaxID=13333 RepID=W1PD19_AMBTC|nr:protein real-time [Amborella trichopoda]XP_020523977.1 protein real-time [Amborella trichopoda]ERN07812.1 hypothetical protein AMTR_s00012p00164920 [Amborella trichopoda]|eukprot:XP_006846137.1 protein real-time [Amborella trichopoda]
MGGRTKEAYDRCLVASRHDNFWQKTLKNVASLKNAKIGSDTSVQLISFLLKVAALDVVRRFSKARVPFLWRGIQGLHVLSCLPFKWMEKWRPLRNLVRGTQKLSAPLFFLSIATIFSDQSDDQNDSPNSLAATTELPESSSEKSTSSTRSSDVSQSCRAIWLRKELDKHEITLPERIDEDELLRFYAASNGDFSCFLSSIKKTIRWRETLCILSTEQLETWCHLVFWHGYDIKFHPCLVIRLGLACSMLESHDRPRLAQAMVSQIEHGVLHHVMEKDPRITVLMDCEGLSTLKFPMHMMKSLSTLVQDHFPNRLATLYVIRLPPVVRIIAQSFIQILKPVTREKLRFEGNTYLRVLMEQFETVPSFLGGQCSCPKCALIDNQMGSLTRNNRGQTRGAQGSTSNGGAPEACGEDEVEDLGFYREPYNDSCDQMLRTTILSILMVWIFIAFYAGMRDPESDSWL